MHKRLKEKGDILKGSYKWKHMVKDTSTTSAIWYQ